MLHEMASDINIDDLPYEILIEIFSYLSVEDLVFNVCKVSRKWEELAEDNKLWKHLTFRPNFQHNEPQIIDVLKHAPKLQRCVSPIQMSRKHFLELITEHCKDIRLLTVSADEDGDIIDKVVKECQNIESFSIHSPNFRGTKVLQAISKCQKLKYLRISGNIAKSNNDIFPYLSQGCPSLHTLNLQFLTNYTNDNLGSFLKQKKDKILCLHLECCRPRQPCSLPMIFELCPKLRQLCVSGHLGTSSSKELILLKTMQNLRCLSMDHFVYYKIEHLTDYFCSHHARNLVSISLSKFILSLDELGNCIYMNCPKVQHLNLAHCSKLRDDSLKLIGNLKDLKSLFLVCCFLTDEGVSYIVKCKQLRHLNLNGIRDVSNDSFVLMLENLKALRELCIDGCKIEPHSLIRIPQELRNLRRIKIRQSGEREMINAISALSQEMPYLKIQ